MKKQVVFEAIVDEGGRLCIRIRGLDPVIGIEGSLSWIPADMGKGFWKKVIRVLKQDTRITCRGGTEARRDSIHPEGELRRLAVIDEKIELIEMGLRRGMSPFFKRNWKKEKKK